MYILTVVLIVTTHVCHYICGAQLKIPRLTHGQANMATLIARISMLLDQTRTSVEEHHRLREIGMSPSSYDKSEIVKGFNVIKTSFARLQEEDGTNNNDAKLRSLKIQYNDLVQLYNQDPTVDVGDLETDIDELSSSADSTPTNTNPAASNAPSKPLKKKSVRFKENLIEDLKPHNTDNFVKPYHDYPSDEEDEGDVAAFDGHNVYRQQQLAMRDQDSRLGALATSVSRQHELSIQIENELDSHLELLDDVDELTDHSQSRLEDAKRRLDVFSRKARENGHVTTIVLLMFIMFILLIVLN